MEPSVKNRTNAAALRGQTLCIYLIFAASGAAALVYQIAWARWLGLIFGNTATSISIVLASFMLGLALGSWLVRRWLHRIANPLLVYAYMELGIGLFAVCFPLFSGAIDRVFTLLVSIDTAPVLSLSVRALLVFALLALPTTLMGATLPLMTDYFRRTPRPGSSWKVGLLYAGNTFGAAVGTIAASFLLIELVGIRSTTLIAAALNLLVAYLAIRYAGSVGLSPAASAPTSVVPLGTSGKLALGVLAASGATALASEVLWTRVLELLMGNSTYAFGTILLLYLLGIALGSWIMSLVVNRLKSQALCLAALQAGMGIWVVIAVVLFNSVSEGLSRYTYDAVSISRLFLHYAQAATLLFPLALLSGAVFPVATRILDPQSKDADGACIARAYAWNTMGSLAGTLVAGFVIAAICDYFQATYLLAVCYGATSATIILLVVTASRGSARRPYAALGLGALSLALVGLGLVGASEEGRFVKRLLRHDANVEVIYHEPGLQGVTTVQKSVDSPFGEILLHNGKGMTRKVTDTKLMAHLPMLIHPEPENALVICFGMGTTYRSAIAHGGRVTAVE
jgi:spermidine synthase